jgi:hypothetical protein
MPAGGDLRSAAAEPVGAPGGRRRGRPKRGAQRGSLPADEVERVDRKEKTREDDRDPAADQRVDESLPGDVRAGHLERDDEDRRRRRLRVDDRPRANRRRHDECRCRADDELPGSDAGMSSACRPRRPRSAARPITAAIGAKKGRP